MQQEHPRDPFAEPPGGQKLIILRTLFPFHTHSLLVSLALRTLTFTLTFSHLYHPDHDKLSCSIWQFVSVYQSLGQLVREFESGVHEKLIQNAFADVQGAQEARRFDPNLHLHSKSILQTPFRPHVLPAPPSTSPSHILFHTSQHSDTIYLYTRICTGFREKRAQVSPALAQIGGSAPERFFSGATLSQPSRRRGREHDEDDDDPFNADYP